MKVHKHSTTSFHIIPLQELCSKNIRIFIGKSQLATWFSKKHLFSDYFIDFMYNSRYLQAPLEELCFARKKMAFISGPRQCGKTTFAKHLLKQRCAGHYFNWDEKTFRRMWAKNPLDILSSYVPSSSTPLFILDEIHKAKSWKRDLKGLYDSVETACDILVTGSAKLNVYRRGGDSLLGRYHHFHLHPFSLAEID